MKQITAQSTNYRSLMEFVEKFNEAVEAVEDCIESEHLVDDYTYAVWTLQDCDDPEEWREAAEWIKRFHRDVEINTT